MKSPKEEEELNNEVEKDKVFITTILAISRIVLYLILFLFAAVPFSFFAGIIVKLIIYVFSFAFSIF